MKQRFKTPNFVRHTKKSHRLIPRECHEYCKELTFFTIGTLVVLFLFGIWRIISFGVHFFFAVGQGVVRGVILACTSFVFVCTLPFRGFFIVSNFFLGVVVRCSTYILWMCRFSTIGIRTIFSVLIVQGIRYIRSFQPPGHLFHRLAGFAAFSVVLTLPFPMAVSLNTLRDVQAQTQEKTSVALEALYAGQDAAKHFRLSDAQSTFQKAVFSFQEAQDTLKTVNGVLLESAKILPYTGKKIIDAEEILEAGKEIARGGEELTKTAVRLTEKNTISFVDFLPLADEVSESLSKAFGDIERAQKRVEGVDEGTIPVEYRERFNHGKEELALAIDGIHEIRTLLDTLREIFGETHAKRYLILFQNNTELRATGGFLGSFAIVDIDKGAIKKIDVPGGGPYDLNGSLSEHVIAPGPLHLINPRWQFQDANWFPDFPTSAQKIMWFYEKSGRESVDGVIAINARVFEELLGIIGPIPLPAYDKTITKANFIDETQKAVELEYDKKVNKPKQFIGDLFSKTLERFQSMNSQTGVKIIDLLLQKSATRDIQIFFKDESLQTFISHHGMSGEILDAPIDYLMIVDSNVGGDKTDRVIETSVRHSIALQKDTSLITTLEITRTHRGKKGDVFSGKKNIDFIRMYVPEGSVMQSTEGFQAPPSNHFKNPPVDYIEDGDLTRIQGEYRVDTISGMATHKEFGKTVFSGWIQTDPDTHTTVRISYRLPFTLKDLEKKMRTSRAPYTLFLQRQSGSSIKKYEVSLFPSDTRTLAWSHVPTLFSQKDETHWESTDGTHDAVFGFLFQ